MTALLFAASNGNDWPGAAVGIAGFALMGFFLWLVFR